MNVCRAALNAERGRALMIQLEASFAVSRAEFWKNCGIENRSEPVLSADAGGQGRGLLVSDRGGYLRRALGAWRS